MLQQRILITAAYFLLPPYQRSLVEHFEILFYKFTLLGLIILPLIPIIALAQLNRKSEDESRQPRMSDLRESGALEQDADLVMLIYRDDVYNRDPNNPEAGTAELIVAKQRNGPTGVVKLAFLREQTRFANLAPGAS